MIFAVIGFWLLMIALKYARLKKGVWDIFWAGLITIFYSLVLFETVPFFLDAAWIIYLGALGTLLFFNLGSVIKGKDDSLSFKELESKYQALVKSSEQLRTRFLGTLDVLEDGLAFIDDDGAMFLTTPALTLFNLDDPELSEATFIERLHPDDQPALKDIRAKAKKSQKKYHTKYRIQSGQKYLWVEETGLYIKVDKTPMGVVQLRGAEVRMFPKTAVDVLNYLPQESDLDAHLLRLHTEEKPYRVVAMRLSNIPGINAKYGRDVGDMMMGEFLKKMKFHFMKEDAIYRLQGILFIMVLKDLRKADMLEKALKEDSSLLQTTVDMGGINESVYPYFGVVHVERFDAHALDVKAKAVGALKEALTEDLQDNYSIVEV